jgi:hypothetical protein
LPPINTTSKASSRPAKPTAQNGQSRERRDSSPQRPTYSPITPPLNPVQFPPPRQTYAHSSQTTATAIPPPPVEPIDFNSNPDVLALKSAISLLQMQSAKARRDMVTLQKAKTAALDEPDAFLADLSSGKVTMSGGQLRSERRKTEDTSEDDDDEDEERADEEMTDAAGPDTGKESTKASKTSKSANKKTKAAPTKHEPEPMVLDEGEPKPWATLPKQQNIYRTPPINWSQYAVAGDSLDKLHNEQVARPSQGVPATVGADGKFEIKPGTGRQAEYVGIQAPYDALRDKLPDKKRKPSS